MSLQWHFFVKVNCRERIKVFRDNLIEIVSKGAFFINTNCCYWNTNEIAFIITISEEVVCYVDIK